MTQTILGFFDSSDTAHQAAAQLQQAGIPAGRIDVAVSEGERGPSAFNRFFQRLFADRSEPNVYAHAASTSKAVVTVHTDTEEQALEVANVLKRAGAQSVDDPNTEYETSSSLNPYQAPEDDIVKNEYDPHTYSAAPEYKNPADGHAPQSRNQVLQEQERKATQLHDSINKELGLHD